jgi:uncharacterized protein involved in exopolysaccharide biosynthesis
MDREEYRRENHPKNYHYEEDEINLLDIFIVLLKRKWMIFWIVFFTGVVALTYSLIATKIYRSECTIIPIEQEKASIGSRLSELGGFGAMVASQVGIGGAGSLEKFEIVLGSRELTNDIITTYKLMPILYKKDWDAKDKKWKVDEPPTLQDAYEKIQETLLTISPNIKKNSMKLGFMYEDPVVAHEILTYYVKGLSEFLREQTLENVTVQRESLQKQLASTSDPLLKTKLTEIIAQYMEKETLAKVQKNYGFDIIDPPFIPEKKFKPKRAVICILSVMVAFFMAIFLAFFMEYISNLKKNEDPERLENLNRYMKLRNK